jgi:hypothetical protein
MIKKVLIPLYRNDIAPRFDLATEVLLATLDPQGKRLEEKTIVLPRPSSEKLCQLILTEGIHAVICGGIEEEYYQYLIWKRVEVLDSVIGPFSTALERFTEGKLQAGDNLYVHGG